MAMSYLKGAKTRLDLAPDMIAAGATAVPNLQPDQAVRILTGAPIPQGADTVLMEGG